MEASENRLYHLLRSGPYQAAVANVATGEGATWGKWALVIPFTANGAVV